MLFLIRFGAPEDGQDSIAHEFVNRSVMQKNYRYQSAQVIVQHFNDVGGVHLTGQLRKTPDVSVENRYLASPAAQP